MAHDLTTDHYQALFKFTALPPISTIISDTIDTAPLFGTATFIAKMGLGFNGLTVFTMQEADLIGGPWTAVPNIDLPNLTFGDDVPGGGFVYSLFGPTASSVRCDLELRKRFLRISVAQADANFVWDIAIQANKKLSDIVISQANQI